MVTITPLNSMLDRMATLNRTMEQAFAPNGEASVRSNGQPAWVPSLDAWETEAAFVVQLDLPGITAEEVDINFDRSTLTIRGTRARPETGERKVFFAERDWGSFTRVLRFPPHVDSERIDAKFANGVLTITVPKAESAKPRKIAVTTSA